MLGQKCVFLDRILQRRQVQNPVQKWIKKYKPHRTKDAVCRMNDLDFVDRHGADLAVIVLRRDLITGRAGQKFVIIPRTVDEQIKITHIAFDLCKFPAEVLGGLPGIRLVCGIFVNRACDIAAGTVFGHPVVHGFHKEISVFFAVQLGIFGAAACVIFAGGIEGMAGRST